MNSEVLHAILVAAIFAAGFLGVGGGVLRMAGVLAGKGDALRLSPIAMAIGFAIVSYVAYGLIAFAPPRAEIVLLVMVVGIATGYRYWNALLSDVRSNLSGVLAALRTLIPFLFLVLSFGFLLIVSTRWFTPPSEGDALYGYMFNARWLYSRGLTLSPYNTAYNLYPFNTELVFALALAFGNDLIPKVLDAILGLFLLGGVFEFARRFADTRSSFFAAVSLATMNAYASTWSSGKVDILCTLTLFSGVSLLFHSGQSVRGLVLSAFLVGTACAQKYTVWVFAAGFVLGLTILMSGEPRGKILRRIVIASVIILVCLLPHFAKTLAWTSNPVAPFGRSVFASTVIFLNPIEASDATRLSLAELATLPYKLFFDFDLPRWPGPFPLLILIGVPLVWVFDAPVPLRRLALFVALQLALWIAIRGGDWLVPRFLLAQTALLLVVAAKGVSLGSRKMPAFGPAVTLTMALLLGYLGIWQNRDWRRSWTFVLGHEDRATWHERLVPARGFRAIQSVAPSLGPNRRLFLTASLYYVPDAQLPYINTEREMVEFLSSPQGERFAFLRARCFGFVHVFGSVKDNPPWTNDLPVLAQWKDSDGGLEYTLFSIDAPCAGSDTLPPDGAAARLGCGADGDHASVSMFRGHQCP